jgi:hypothetical protein
MYFCIQDTFSFSICVGRKANPSNQIPVNSPDKVNATKMHTPSLASPRIHPNKLRALDAKATFPKQLALSSNGNIKIPSTPVTCLLKPKMLLTCRANNANTKEIVSFFTLPIIYCVKCVVDGKWGYFKLLLPNNMCIPFDGR